MDTKTNESPTIKTSNINAIAAVMALLVVMMTNTMNIICIFLHIYMMILFGINIQTPMQV